MKNLKSITIAQWQIGYGTLLQDIPLTYQLFGPPLGTAPVVVVNHALTGNSNVAGDDGWWGGLIGSGKTINTENFAIVAFNIPGNGYDGNADNLIHNYTHFTVNDIALLFWLGLDELGITHVHTVIGGSLGGGIAWHMAALRPKSITHLIAVATDWKATDWVIANVLVQDRILNNSAQPVADARLHAMLLYRTPQSLQQRFKREHVEGVFKIEQWLNRHGKKLEERFTLASYRLANYLLRTINIANTQSFISVAKNITAQIHLVAVDTDQLFTPDETLKTFEALQQAGNTVYYHEIQSIHGHDAFLIECGQLSQFLAPVFTAG